MDQCRDSDPEEERNGSDRDIKRNCSNDARENGEAVCTDSTRDGASNGADCGQFQPEHHAQPVVSVVPKNYAGSKLDDQDINNDTVSHANTNQQPSGRSEERQQRRPSLSERRGFRTPLSAPHEKTVFSTDPVGQRSGNQKMGSRKTSLPAVVSRPTGLDLPRGDGARPRGSKRLSESQQDEYRTGAMPKSVSDNHLVHRPLPGASYNPQAPAIDGSCAQLRDTRTVVQSFIATAYQREESPATTEETPSSATVGVVGTPDLPPEFERSPLSPSAEVGRRLALLADAFDQRYGGELDEMARLVLPHILGKARGNAEVGQSLTFEVFRNVARKLFEGPEITWGRIVALLTFGYRLVLAVLRAGLQCFVSRIVDLVCKFIVVEPIANWISRQGGWFQALFSLPASENPRWGAVADHGYWLVQALAVAFLAYSWFKNW